MGSDRICTAVSKVGKAAGAQCSYAFSTTIECASQYCKGGRCCSEQAYGMANCDVCGADGKCIDCSYGYTEQSDGSCLYGSNSGPSTPAGNILPTGTICSGYISATCQAGGRCKYMCCSPDVASSCTKCGSDGQCVENPTAPDLNGEIRDQAKDKAKDCTKEARDWRAKMACGGMYALLTFWTSWEGWVSTVALLAILGAIRCIVVWDKKYGKKKGQGGDRKEGSEEGGSKGLGLTDVIDVVDAFTGDSGSGGEKDDGGVQYENPLVKARNLVTAAATGSSTSVEGDPAEVMGTTEFHPQPVGAGTNV